MDVALHMREQSLGRSTTSFACQRGYLGEIRACESSKVTDIVEVVRHYIALITEKQSSYLDEIEAIENPDELAEFLSGAFEPNSDARLFEIVSFVLLAEHFRGQSVWVGSTSSGVKEQPLRLFRSGRTNANDGGIDFVLTPLGRFFQVTETLDFGKYFLDFEKVNRFPISFVVKVEAKSTLALEIIRRTAEKSGRYDQEQVDLYMGLFEEVFKRSSFNWFDPVVREKRGGNASSLGAPCRCLSLPRQVPNNQRIWVKPPRLG